MNRFMLTLTLLSAAFSGSQACAVNEQKDAGVTYLRTAPTALSTNSAYLLMRVSTAKSGLFPIQQVLLRVPTEEELAAFHTAKKAAYDNALPGLTKKAKGGKVPSLEEFTFTYRGKPNSFVVESGKSLDEGEMRTMLLQVPAGDYVLFGVTSGSRILGTCNCLGTVRFAARAGAITDVGSLYADKVHKPSPVPHLEDNLGPQMGEYGFVFGAGLVPADSRTLVPAAMHGLKIEPARFTVVGQFYEPGASAINRLAPIPGILGYVHGKPIDLQTGKVAE